MTFLKDKEVGESGERDIIEWLGKHGFKYKKNTHRLIDLIPEGWVGPSIEVKTCTSSRMRLRYDKAGEVHPMYHIFQLYKKSYTARTLSGPWRAFIDDPNSFFFVYFPARKVRGVDMKRHLYIWKTSELLDYLNPRCRPDGLWWSQRRTCPYSEKITYLLKLETIEKNVPTWSPERFFASISHCVSAPLHPLSDSSLSISSTSE